ncbi:MAG: DmsC/YnfH family molybdoenzyme membrane anchor subunit [Burkholderiaceae bacterium]
MSGSTYGPNPWQQTQWDWRAAGNFVCGGAGGGLIVLGVASGAEGLARVTLLLAGLALVGAGLLCVWLEIGRPLRALHVFFNPRTSWMTREAFVAALLMPVALASAFGLVEFRWLAALLALAFVYCQARIVQGAKGIPAWREPLVVPLLVLTGLAEGAGLLLLVQPARAASQLMLLGFIGALVIGRGLLWPAYQRRLAATAAPRALAALDAAGSWLQHTGSIVPLLLIALATSGYAGGALRDVLLALAGVLIAATGAWLKFTLITRAGFNQGFALVHLPVRGVRR